MELDSVKIGIMYRWLMGNEIDTDEKGNRREFPIRVPLYKDGIRNESTEKTVLEKIEYIKECMGMEREIVNVWVFNEEYTELIKLQRWEDYLETMRLAKGTIAGNKKIDKFMDRWGEINDITGEWVIRRWSNAGAINSANDTMNYYKNKRIVNTSNLGKKKNEVIKRKKYRSFKV